MPVAAERRDAVGVAALAVVDIAQDAGEIALVGVVEVILRDHLGRRQAGGAPALAQKFSKNGIFGRLAIETPCRSMRVANWVIAWIVALAGLRVLEIRRHRQVALHQIVARQTADIRPPARTIRG